jgi:hypothetical protein
MTGVRRFLAEEEGLAFDSIADRVLFIGDSPNDEPLFAAFPHSIAVGNLRSFLGRLSSFPQYITESDSAAGFCEAAAEILRKRGTARTLS